MTKTALITGNSSGLGFGLSEACLQQSWKIFGLSRRGYPNSLSNVHDVLCDLEREELIAPALARLLGNVEQIDIVFLNAGIFGKLKPLADIELYDIERIMQVNVWANKTILDWLFAQNIEIKQVIAISSGAAISATKGWACYSLSKAALNKLMQLYATEYGDTHFISLAPGLVDTAMQDYLCDDNEAQIRDFPALEKFRLARGTEAMPQPIQTANAILGQMDHLTSYESGSFVDIRNL
ncbi:MAG: SDR family NAD(P)-dependent oxidoreductase [Gammaproteobacteria bacterium]|nr:SDR family NAD(P)-dependent oxidoreductase [Gammaproteobacteria bacterium]